MGRSLTRFFLLPVSAAVLLTACSANPPYRQEVGYTLPAYAPAEEDVSVELALAEAESLCAAGSQASADGDWTGANQDFSNALEILSTLSLDDGDSEGLSGRLDALLFVLSSEYPRVLSHLEELPDESSLAMLLIKLGSLRSDSLAEVEIDSVVATGDQVAGITYDVPIHWNAEVERSMQLFLTQNRAAFSTWLRRSGRYTEMMRGILREYDLPEDLIHAALIESGFNPNAYSWAHAAGPWQFISSTGKLYGLKNDWWLDERRDPEKSTRAAARYLKDLYQEFHSWPLALAAYNCGENRVRKAIKKAGSTDFWVLNLPRQTRNYVPLFMAATVIAKNPEKYGFTIDYETPQEYDVVEIDECTDLRVAARCCGTSHDRMKSLNPELRRWCTPPNNSSYKLKIPKGTKSTFLKNYALVPASERVTWERHRIRKGETLSGIANRYGTSASAIKEANSLRSSNRIIAGKYLLIPVSPTGSFAGSVVAPTAIASESGGKLIYTVKRGDALSRIAASFGISLSQLRRWNNLRSGQYIYPGDKLTIYLSDDMTGSAASTGDYSEMIYTVKRGDTLWDIANDFGVSLSDLVRENELKDPSRLKPGSKLKIKMSRKL